MFTPDPSATTASQPQPSDIQQLVGLLGNLMPLLMRFQPQSFPSQAFQPHIPEHPFQGVRGQGAPGDVFVPNPALDRQAAENLVGDITAASLRTLSAYLEVNAGRHPGLENCVPIVTQAAHRFGARDYAEAFNLIWLAYRAIETIRATNPQLPPLRAGGPAAADQTSSSVH